MVESTENVVALTGVLLFFLDVRPEWLATTWKLVLPALIATYCLTTAWSVGDLSRDAETTRGELVVALLVDAAVIVPAWYWNWRLAFDPIG